MPPVAWFRTPAGWMLSSRSWPTWPRAIPALPADALKLNADKHKGVTFHTLSFEVPDDVDNAEFIEQLIGEKSTLTVGIGKESAFLALGNKGIETLKKVIDKSEGVTERPTSPLS